MLDEGLKRAARSDLSVLLTGPSGVGKSRLAREIHSASARAEGPFEVLDCGGLPEDLLDSILFGHVAGAFTGASQSQPGVFERADGGTLLLERVDEMPASLQVRLLRVLQEGVVSPLGSNDPREVDVRIISTASERLEALVAAGDFRTDLYYRLHVITVSLPALAARRDEIPSLSQELLGAAARELGVVPQELGPRTRDALRATDWPGNIRELDNFLRRCLALSDPSNLETMILSELSARRQTSRSFIYGETVAIREDIYSYRDASQELEGLMIDRALREAGGKRDQAAALLGISRRALFYKLRARDEE
jgi:DNA-binding NtrC family response regulator